MNSFKELVVITLAFLITSYLGGVFFIVLGLYYLKDAYKKRNSDDLSDYLRFRLLVGCILMIFMGLVILYRKVFILDV